jgi:outer membrane protein assembly factor BamA
MATNKTQICKKIIEPSYICLYMKYIFTIILYFLLILPSFAQTQALRITGIEIEGNKKTKAKVILRELTFHEGDTLNLDNRATFFDANQLRLMNLNLFRSVILSLKDSTAQETKILVKVIEPLYIWTGWYVELADRNFNVWWKEEKLNPRRINMALTPLWRNITGRRDYLKGIAQVGYTQKGELEYGLPGFDKRQQFGLHANVYYTRAREIAFTTEKNKLKFYFDENQFQLERMRFYTGFSYRPRLESTHSLRVQYDRTKIGSFVADSLNTTFLGKGKSKQQFVTLEYHFTFDRRDVRPYPERGVFAALTLKKEGLSSKADVNTLYATALWGQYNRINRWSLENIFKIRKELLGNTLPYFNTRGLGYQEDYIRGYEYYVLDGRDYAYWKATLRYKFFERKLDFKKYSPFESWKKKIPLLPFRIYVAAHSDLGYVRNTNALASNTLLNKVQWGRGVGLVAIFNYDDVIELDLSQNQLNDWGTYLHFKTPLK